jgi:restriction system protein
VWQTDDRLERLLVAVASKGSDGSLVTLAMALYGGIGLALPILLSWSIPWLVAANVTGAMLAMSLIMARLALISMASRRRNLLEWTTDLRHLDAKEFEWLVGEMFRREGWKVSETGRHDGPDGGLDLVLTRARERLLVQCKRWQSWSVGVEDVRAFAGVLSREQADGGIFVTMSDFTEAARADAAKLGMTLIDGVDLFERVEKVRKPEPCPLCGSAMLLDRSTYGWWFHCIAPHCRGKRDLDRDPGLAVDLLTRPPTRGPSHGEDEATGPAGANANAGSRPAK